MKKICGLVLAVCALVLLRPGTGAGYDIAAWLRARITPAMVPVVESSRGRYKVEVVLGGLDSPWAIVPMPDGRIFITERPGRLRVVQNNQVLSAAVPGLPRVSYQGQGGLLDMTLHPDYTSNRLVYLAYTIDSDAGLMTRISRFKETPEGLKEMKVIFPGFPGSDKPKHFGSRMVFGLAGGNYGWPTVHHRETKEGMIAPLLEYTPAVAPAGAMFYTGALFPQWKNDFFFATLVGRKLVRVKFKDQEPLEQEFLIGEHFGRLRAAAQGIDGSILVITSDTDAYGPGRGEGDRLLRLIPLR